jgi:hypothetical protein
MEKIKQTISRVMRELGGRQKNSRADEIGVWLEKALSAKERKHISSYSEYKGILRFRVDSSSWIYYLNLKKEAWLSGIRQSLPRIKEIRFSVSEKNEKTKNKRT